MFKILTLSMILCAVGAAQVQTVIENHEKLIKSFHEKLNEFTALGEKTTTSAGAANGQNLRKFDLTAANKTSGFINTFVYTGGACTTVSISMGKPVNKCLETSSSDDDDEVEEYEKYTTDGSVLIEETFASVDCSGTATGTSEDTLDECIAGQVKSTYSSSPSYSLPFQMISYEDVASCKNNEDTGIIQYSGLSDGSFDQIMSECTPGSGSSTKMTSCVEDEITLSMYSSSDCSGSPTQSILIGAAMSCESGYRYYCPPAPRAIVPSWEPCTSKAVNPNPFPSMEQKRFDETSMNFTLDDHGKSCQLSMTGVRPEVLSEIRKVSVKLMRKQENKQYKVETYRSPESPIAFPISLSLSGLDFEYSKVKVKFHGFPDPGESKKHKRLFCAWTKILAPAPAPIAPAPIQPIPAPTVTPAPYSPLKNGPGPYGS